MLRTGCGMVVDIIMLEYACYYILGQYPLQSVFPPMNFIDMGDTDETETREILNSQRKVKVYRLVKTVILQHVWIAMGLWSTVVTPCIDALKEQIQCNYEEISRALAFKSIGIMVGSLGGGILADRYKRWIDVQMAISLVLCGLSIGAIPWCPNLPLMTVAFLTCGLGQGSISAGGNNHALTMWGKDANGPFHYIHAGYGIGTVLGPVIVAPFVTTVYNNTAHHNHSQHKIKSTSQDYQFYVPSVSMQTFEHGTNFPLLFSNHRELSNANNSNNTTDINTKTPFAVAGSYSFLIAVIFFIYAFFPYISHTLPTTMHDNDQISPSATPAVHETQSNKKSWKQILSPGSCAGGNTIYGLQMFLMIFLFYILLVGKDNSVGMLAQPIAVHTKTLGFTLKEADLLIMVYFICYTSGRIVISVFGKWVPVQLALFVESIGVFASLLAMVLVGLNSKLNFWLTMCFYGIFTGPVFPSGMAWCDRYVQMTATAFAVLDIGIGVGLFFFSWLYGYLLNKHPDNVVVIYYVGLGCAVLSLILLVIMQIRGSLHGDRYKMQQESIQKDVPINESESDGDRDTSPLIQ